MKQKYEYTVVYRGQILVDEFRGDRITGEAYRVIKTPQFGDPTEYQVVFSTLGDWCNCPGHENHGHCKHVKMVQDYKENQSGSQETHDGS